MARPRHNLPAQPTPLVGREQDVAAIRERVLFAQVRLLTLTGPAGVGKTRLAVEAAAALLDAFEHGVCYVNLAATREPTLVMAAIARALELRRSLDVSLKEVVAQCFAER